LPLLKPRPGAGPWRSFESIEFATLEWVDWFNHRRLLVPIGNISPTEAEDRYYTMMMLALESWSSPHFDRAAGEEDGIAVTWVRRARRRRRGETELISRLD
jgi:hypothetical protein